jgi:tetratricopeptide (TPR) repeat protein
MGHTSRLTVSLLLVTLMGSLATVAVAAPPGPTPTPTARSSSPAAGTAGDPQALFALANQKYFAGDWDGAARAYADIVERFEIEDPALYHNLGNACFRSGAYGSAILYYRRAQKLEPDSKLSDALDKNLDAARRTLQARYRATSDSALVFASPADALYQVTHLLDELPLSLGFLVVWAALFSLLIARRLRPDARWPGRLAIAAGLVALLAGLLVWGRVATEGDNQLGVVVASGSLLRDGRHALAQGKDLPEGIEVLIVDSEGEWLQVELSSGRRGWVSAADVKQI